MYNIFIFIKSVLSPSKEKSANPMKNDIFEVWLQENIESGVFQERNNNKGLGDSIDDVLLFP